MSNVFTLDSLREEADKQFAPFKVQLSDGTEVVLRNLLRLNKNDRKTVLASIEALKTEDESEEGRTLDDIDRMVDTVSKILELAAGKDSRKLLKELDGDLGLLMGVLEGWLEATSPGGSAELAGLIDRYGEHLVPDLKHYYGIDLRELFSEVNPLSPQYVLIHIKHLPIESAFVAAIRGGQEFRGWNADRYALAAIINSIRAGNYMFVMANSDPRKGKPPLPSPWPVPQGNKAEKKYAPNSFAGIVAAQVIAARKRKQQKKEAEWQAQEASKSAGFLSGSSQTSTGSTES
ncbi:tail assembly chaperone [Mycobacterium phage Cintron]|uniref:Tail assembly chaperone n=1 Tax=Mycobacterium phage Cintron TaxID=2686232 RepID=A0A6B9L828_9CAUD|nr:tail assembly chaperone [Mycobacterium phage Cintron]QHB38032.1 tail assembly chaperone [Mycobacterium phage Cintron]